MKNLKKSKHKNYFFSGVDFIYEFFNIERKINNNFLSKSVQLIVKNKILINYLLKLLIKEFYFKYRFY